MKQQLFVWHTVLLRIIPVGLALCVLSGAMSAAAQHREHETGQAALFPVTATFDSTGVSWRLSTDGRSLTLDRSVDFGNSYGAEGKRWVKSSFRHGRPAPSRILESERPETRHQSGWLDAEEFGRAPRPVDPPSRGFHGRPHVLALATLPLDLGNDDRYGVIAWRGGVDARPLVGLDQDAIEPQRAAR